jgi:gliding motility-associated-like protein
MLIVSAQSVFAQFPYFESFKNSTAPDIIFGGEPEAYLTSGQTDLATGISDPIGEGYLRLTRKIKNQKGFIHNKVGFSSQFGLRIEFEYFTYGGFDLGADGITFFLYDAAVSDNDFKIGGFGGSLGYAQYKAAADPAPTAGVTGGYLGIGIDEFGNFANPTELRVGGTGFVKSSITMRGRGSGTGATIPNTTIGNYRYLTHKQDFNLVSGGRSPLPTDIGYRKIVINLKPAISPLTGYFISVELITGGATQKNISIINNYHYADAAPDVLKYGIASSTGADFNYHEIRNLRINTFEPVPPVAVNDLNNTTGKNTRIFIPVIDNDTDINGSGTILKNSLTKVAQQTPGALIEPDLERGGFYYTPALDFSGKDSFTYTIKDESNLVSNVGRVDIDVVIVTPDGSPDAAKTKVNTPIQNLDVLINDASKIGTTVIVAPATEKGGTVIVNADRTIKYTPPVDYSGNDSFTYILKSTDNLQSPAILVSLVIHRPPTARNDSEETNMDTPVSIDLAANDNDDGVLNKASIIIKSPPTNGTLAAPNAEGIIVYTPKRGFSGTDTFTYTIKDNDAAESAPATVTIKVNSVPKIGLAKNFPIVKNSINGTFVLRFTFVLGNYGSEPLEKISLKDDLSAAFGGAEVKIIAINPTGSLKKNVNYNGISNIEMLDPASTLAPNTKESVELVINVLITVGGSYQNSAITQGFSAVSGLKTTDESVAGEKPDPFAEGDVTSKGPTFFTLTRGEMFIPEGFSPNNDGTNDLFIISNAQEKVIALEVFNRWGNKVYKSADYKNDWAGRCTEGIYIGQDLPVGTYYYIAVIDNEEKRMGYITINR